MDRHERAAGCVEDAHDKEVACLDWHPLGHLLATGGHDLTTYSTFILSFFIKFMHLFSLMFNRVFNWQFDSHHTHLWLTAVFNKSRCAYSKFWIRNRPGDGLVSQRGAGAEEEAEQVELAEPGAGSAASALTFAGAPAKRAKAGGARGSLPELVSRLASVLPMARTLPHLRALLAEQQQQKAGAAEAIAASAGAAHDEVDVKRVKLAASAIPGLDLVSSEGFEQFS